MGYGFLGSLNFFNSLNAFRRPEHYFYNDEAMRALSPRTREELLRDYYQGLGLSEKTAFNAPLQAYFKAQEKAFADILEQHDLTPKEKTTLLEQLRGMQAPITQSAQAFDRTMPGKAPTAVHPGAFQQHATEEKGHLLTEVRQLDLTPLLEVLKTKTKRPPKIKEGTQTVEKRRRKQRPVELDILAEALGTEAEIQQRMHLAQEITQLEEAAIDQLGAQPKIEQYRTKLSTAIRQSSHLRKLEREVWSELTKANPNDSDKARADFKDALNARIDELADKKLNQQQALIEAARSTPGRATPDLTPAELAQLATQELSDAAARKTQWAPAPGDEYETVSTQEHIKFEKSDKTQSVDLEKVTEALQAAQKKAEKTLEDNLNKAVTDLHQAAERERMLLGWLLAAEVAQKELANASFFSSPPKDYTVLMTGSMQERVQKLQKAIQEKDERTINESGGIHTPTGTNIAISPNENGELSFSIQFPGLLFSRSYYTNARHNTKADLLFQAALVRGTGAKTIITNINHENEGMRMQLAREAYEAAEENGYKRDEITIQIQGQTMKPEQLFEKTLTDVRASGNQQPPKINVDISGSLAGVSQSAQKQIEPDAAARREMQSRMKEVLDQGRADYPDLPVRPAAPAA